MKSSLSSMLAMLKTTCWNFSSDLSERDSVLLRCSFFIHAGDLINSAHREQEWHEWFTAGGFIHGMIPSMLIPGNHEYRAKNQNKAARKGRSLPVQWRPQFKLPLNGPKGWEETEYYMDYQDVRMVFLDSNRDQVIQADWLEEVLKNNPKKWTILTYHHPLF